MICECNRLETEDQLVMVDDVKVNGDNVVELVRGSNLVGTKVEASRFLACGYIYIYIYIYIDLCVCVRERERERPMCVFVFLLV